MFDVGCGSQGAAAAASRTTGAGEAFRPQVGLLLG